MNISDLKFKDLKDMKNGSLLTNSEMKVLSFLKSLNPIITRLEDITSATGLSERTIKRVITTLFEKRYILSKKRYKKENYQGIEYTLTNYPLTNYSQKPIYCYCENINQNSLVVKSNRLIEARYKLSLQEQRIIASMISKIQKDDEDLKIYRFDVKSLSEQLGLRVDGYYDELKKVTDDLLKKMLKIDGEILQIGWLSSAEYKKGYIELEFAPKLKPYLLQLKQAFTKYKLMNIIKLNNSYSIRIYELLKQYEKIGERKLNLDELKDLLCLGQGYKYNDIKRLLLKIKEEITENTDITFTFKENKLSHKIVSLTFYILQKNIPTLLQPEKKELILHNEIVSLLNFVPEQHRKKKAVIDLINKHIKFHNSLYVKYNIEYTNNQIKDPKKYPAFLSKSLENDWGQSFYEDQLYEADKNAKANELIRKKAEEDAKYMNIIKADLATHAAIEALPEEERLSIKEEARNNVLAKLGKNAFGFEGHVRFESYKVYRQRYEGKSTNDKS